MHILSFFCLPFSICAFEYEDIEEDDEDTYDDREECGDLGTGSECHKLEVNNISGKLYCSDKVRREFFTKVCDMHIHGF